MNTTQPAGEMQPLWSAEQIKAAIRDGWKQHGYVYHYEWIEHLMFDIRDDCEAERATLQQRIVELEAQVADVPVAAVRAMLAGMDSYHHLAAVDQWMNNFEAKTKAEGDDV